MSNLLSKLLSLKPHIGAFLMGIFILIVVFTNDVLFFWYLYTPLVGAIRPHQIKKPLLDEVLLKAVVKKIDENNQDLSKKLQENYPDPFE